MTYITYKNIKFTPSSQEVIDALSAPVLEKLIDTNIQSLIDHDKWRETRDEQTEKREILATLSERWDDIRPFVQNLIDE